MYQNWSKVGNIESAPVEFWHVLHVSSLFSNASPHRGLHDHYNDHQYMSIVTSPITCDSTVFFFNSLFAMTTIWTKKTLKLCITDRDAERTPMLSTAHDVIIFRQQILAHALITINMLHGVWIGACRLTLLLILYHITEADRCSGWQRWSSLMTLKLAFNVTTPEHMT